MWYKEITKWDTEVNIPNHSYYITKSGRITKYKPSGSDTIIEFSGKGLQFDKRYRKFVKLTGAKWND